MIRRALRVFDLGAGAAIVFTWQGTPSRAEEYAVRKAATTLVHVLNGEKPAVFFDYSPGDLADRLIVRPASLGVPSKGVSKRLPR